VARAIRRQLAFGLRRTIPLALPRDLAIEVACFVAEAMKDVPTTGCHWCVRDHATGRLRIDGLSECDARQVACDLNSDDDDNEPEFI